MFFFNISIRVFFNKKSINYGFITVTVFPIKPYMAIYGHIWPVFFGRFEMLRKA